MIRNLNMDIVGKEEDFYKINIKDDKELVQLKFNVETKTLKFISENNLAKFLKDNEYQFRKLLHNKRPKTFYIGFKLKFSIIDGKNIEAFNDKKNIVVLDHSKIYVIDRFKKKNLVEVFTDGSFNEKNLKGGYAFLIKTLDGLYHEEAFETDSNSSSLIELEAVISALQYIKGDVRIVTDSQYVRKGITEWIVHWKLNNWMTANGTKAKNIDNWLLLDKLVKNRYVELEWVKGHSDNFENDYCDLRSREMTKNMNIK